MTCENEGVYSLKSNELYYLKKTLLKKCTLTHESQTVCAIFYYVYLNMTFF